MVTATKSNSAQFSPHDRALKAFNKDAVQSLKADV